MITIHRPTADGPLTSSSAGARAARRRVPVLIAWLAAMLPFASFAGPVNINTADASTLARELKGVGLARAQAIVEYRQKHGPFKNADDLANVKGIGMRVVNDNRANIRIDKSDKATDGTAVADKGKKKSPAGDKAAAKDD